MLNLSVRAEIPGSESEQEAQLRDAHGQRARNRSALPGALTDSEVQVLELSVMPKACYAPDVW